MKILARFFGAIVGVSLLSIGIAHAQIPGGGSKGALIVATCGTLPSGVTYAAKQLGYVTVDTTGTLCSAGGGGSGGTSSTFGAAFPATGTAVGAKDSTGTNMAALNLDASGNLKTIGGTVSHASTTALGTSLVAKASAGSLFGYNCSGVAGGAAGFCIAYNGTAAPPTGALTGSLVLDFCYHDTTPRGCSLSRIPVAVAYSTGIVILETSATTPYTYTTGTNTAAISADYQ